MKKLLSKGRIVISCVSIFAILMASVLSVFANNTWFVLTEDSTIDTETTITYPLNGKYDTDFIVNEGDDAFYTEPKGTVVSDFTGYATNFITYAKGSGTQYDPYIIETANEFAAVVTGNLYDANGNYFSTQHVAFKVDENVKAFNLNNTNSTVDFSGDLTAEEVRTALENASVAIEWKSVKPFAGKLDGSGVVVYGLKAIDRKSALIPDTNDNVTVMNLTVKNSYFCGVFASALIAHNYSPNGQQKQSIITLRNIDVHNNVVLCNQTSGSIGLAGVLIGSISTPEGANMLLDDSLVYGNIAKHETRNITYGIVSNLSRATGSIINNCIIMDSVPHGVTSGYNAFHNTKYKNVYTNTCDGTAWYNYDGDIAVDDKGEYVIDDTNGGYIMTSGTKYKYTYTANGSLSAALSHYKPGASTSSDSYTKKYEGPVYYVKSSEIQGTKIIDGIDSQKWTYNDGDYPTPKVYNAVLGEGIVSNTFFDGDGSKITPYVITTAEEFAYMLVSDNLGKYYKLANDITINDTSVGNWTQNARTWFTSNDVPEFKGILDGNGKTISGIYYDGTQKGEYAGLIPVAGSAASIDKLGVAKSELNGDSGAIGAVVGTVSEKAKSVIKLNALTVEETVKYGGNAANGIVGKIGNSVIQVTNCITEASGIFGINEGIAKIYSCISVNAYPFEDATNVSMDNVYSGVEGNISNIKYVPVEKMLGSAAESSMPGLKFPKVWLAVENDFPIPTGAEASSEGVKGQLWSGTKATGFAGGSGTKEDPYQIETAEQLAYCVWKDNVGTLENRIYYKLTADIYLNDINSSLWDEKLGCNQWFASGETQSVNNFKYTVLDGDGHIIYGLYYEHPASSTSSVRVGLIPTMGVGSVVKNVAISGAYIDMYHPDDFAATIAGSVDAWNNSKWPMNSKDAVANAGIRNDEEFQANQPQIINCLADSTCYVSAQKNYGGFVGASSGCFLMENCIYTGSIAKSTNVYFGGALYGVDWSNGVTIKDCVSLPQCCNKVVGGYPTETWREGNTNYITITWDDVYYFSSIVQGCSNEGIVKINRPDNRIGNTAKSVMVGLDWVDEFDETYYNDVDSTTWLVIDDGTPVPSIFAKHRTVEELKKLSDTNFSPPIVTVTFFTDTNEVVVEDMVGPMYSPLSLPEVSRFGYEFKGWHVFADLSYVYDKDYFPPRDLQLYAEWKVTGAMQNFENYTDTIWDYDSDKWILNKPGAKGGYKVKYVRNGARSMHLLGTNTEPADVLLNYEQMLKPGHKYTIKFWVTTDNDNNPDTVLTLVHNEIPDYLDTQVAAEEMVVAKGLRDGEWVQYSYTFTAKTKWVSIRAGANSSLYFDDIIIGESNDSSNSGNLIDTNNGTVSPNTGDTLNVVVLISAIMICAIVSVISKKNLVEVID